MSGGAARRHRRLRAKVWFRKQRYAIRQNPHADRTYRVAVAVVGALMIAAGAVLVPLPTPGFGWILIFLGLGVLSTEFAWAKRITHWLHRVLDWARAWWGRRSAAQRSGLIGGLAVGVAAVLWLSGSVGTAAAWVGLEHSWLDGPLRHR